MSYIFRKVEGKVKESLERQRSVLLIGPRQTGKTTLVNQLSPDHYISLLRPETRLRYEHTPSLLEKEVESIAERKQMPLVIIDEVQKIPSMMDLIQYLIDQRKAVFILTGSSVRKLKRGSSVNLLPGRLNVIELDPLSIVELGDKPLDLNDILLYGTLPGIYLQTNHRNQEDDLASYVATYLTEEIRAEALVRNVGNFSRFLELAGLESGRIINMSKISQDIGVSSNTIAEYFQILVDCMIVERVEPYSVSHSRKRLVKASKYLMFDLGVRRACVKEGAKLSSETMGHLFEQFVGLELIRQSRWCQPRAKVHFWRDHDGPEVDYVVVIGRDTLIPIEVKWSSSPDISDGKHIRTFMNEYPEAKKGYIVCRTPNRYKVDESVTAIPWQEMEMLFDRE